MDRWHYQFMATRKCHLLPHSLSCRQQQQPFSLLQRNLSKDTHPANVYQYPALESDHHWHRIDYSKENSLFHPCISFCSRNLKYTSLKEKTYVYKNMYMNKLPVTPLQSAQTHRV